VKTCPHNVVLQQLRQSVVDVAGIQSSTHRVTTILMRTLPIATTVTWPRAESCGSVKRSCNDRPQSSDGKSRNRAVCVFRPAQALLGSAAESRALLPRRRPWGGHNAGNQRILLGYPAHAAADLQPRPCGQVDRGPASAACRKAVDLAARTVEKLTFLHSCTAAREISLINQWPKAAIWLLFVAASRFRSCPGSCRRRKIGRIGPPYVHLSPRTMPAF